MNSNEPEISRDEIKSKILEIFKANVQGVKPDLTGYNLSHDGAEGDWLTKRMGLKPNGKNEPDFHGFEMKKDSRGKTTFGDWSPDIAIYKGANKILDREVFLSIFGSPNPKKDNRYSWSGRVFPKLNGFNDFGQLLMITSQKDIEAIYRHSENSVKNSADAVPDLFRSSDVQLAKWTHSNLKQRLESKFNQLGWFRCLKDETGCYSSIQFGLPINMDTFFPLFKAGAIFIDCGMHQGNPRPYMNFRADNSVWNQLSETILN